MTVPATTRRAGPFNGNDSSTSFPFTFRVFSKEDIQAQLANASGVSSVLVLDSDFSVTLNADQDATPGGAVTYPISGDPLATGEKLVLLGAVPYEQTTDLPAGGAYRASVVEDAFDRTVMQVQQLAEEVGRALTLPPAAAGANTELPAPVANNFIGWDEAGLALRNVDPSTAASIVAYANWRTDKFNGGAASYTLAADPGSVNNCDVAVGGVVQTPGDDFTVSGTTLTPTTAWPAGTNNVVVRYGQALPVGSAAAQDVAVTDAAGLLAASTAEGAFAELAARKAAGWVSVDEPRFGGSIQAALDASLRVYVPAGTYVPTAPLTATVDHQIVGAGFNQTFINPTHTGFALVIAAPTADVKCSLLLDQFTVTGKNGVQVGGTRASHPTDGAIIGGVIRVCVVGTYGSGSGDTAYDTDKVRDAANTLVSSYSGTLAATSALNTFTDIEAYGVGIRLSKCIDTVVQDPQFYGNGVSLALLGCDIIKWRGGRSHEVGLFCYSERVGTWGSQLSMDDVDMLHNRRAGGILLNGTKMDLVRSGYYECYSNAACLVLAEETESLTVDGVRIDDPYYGGASGTTPVMVFVTPRWTNRIRGLIYQKFTAFGTAAPAVRVTGSFASIDSNHTEAVAIEPGSGYEVIRFKDQQPGCRFGPLDYSIYTVDNVPFRIGGDMGPLATADGSKWTFYNASALPLTFRFPIKPLLLAYTLSVNAKTISGTALAVLAQHYRYDDTFVSTLFNGNLTGLSTTAYTTATQALALGFEPQQGDYIVVTITSNLAKLNAVRVA